MKNVKQIKWESWMASFMSEQYKKQLRKCEIQQQTSKPKITMDVSQRVNWNSLVSSCFKILLRHVKIEYNKMESVITSTIL